MRTGNVNQCWILIKFQWIRLMNCFWRWIKWMEGWMGSSVWCNFSLGILCINHPLDLCGVCYEAFHSVLPSEILFSERQNSNQCKAKRSVIYSWKHIAFNTINWTPDLSIPRRIIYFVLLLFLIQSYWLKLFSCRLGRKFHNFVFAIIWFWPMAFISKTLELARMVDEFVL